MKFLVTAAYTCLFTFIVWGMTEAEGARGTISPTNITIDEAPFAATLEQLLASVTIDSVIASNCYPEVTINLTCSFTDASNVSFLQLWFNDGGLSGFQRNFFFFAIEMNRSADNFTVVFQQTLQLREVGGFAELAGEYRCQANTGEETAIATIEVLYRPIFIHDFNGRSDIPLSPDSFSYYSLATVFAVEGTSDNVSLPIAFTGANPPPFGFDWTNNNQSLITLDGSGVGAGGDSGRLVGTGKGLTVLNPRRSDSGVYEVTASNPAGTGRLNTLLVVRYPPEFESLDRVIYLRAGEPLQLNCTPDAHSSSGQNVPLFDLEDSSGSTSITQLSYRLSKNGAEVMTAAAGSSGLFNVSNAANGTDSGIYSCVVQEDVFQKVANIISVARRRRAVVRLPVVSFLSTVLLNRVMDTSLSTAVSFSVVVGDIPPVPRALIVAIVSPNSVEASWLPAQTVQAGTPELVFHQVTLTDLGTGQVLRRNDVISSGIDGDTQQRQHYGDLMPGSYRVTVAAGNVFGLSRSLSQSFDIAVSECFYFYALIASAIVLLIALLFVSALAACLMYVIKRARETAPIAGDLPAVPKGQDIIDAGVHANGHPSGPISESTFEGQTRSASFLGPGEDEGEDGVEPQIPLETNPAYQTTSGPFTAEASAHNVDTRQCTSGLVSEVYDTTPSTGEHDGGQNAGDASAAVREEPLPNDGAPPLRSGAPSQNAGTPPPTVRALPLIAGAPPPNMGAPPGPAQSDGTPPPNDEAAARVSGIYESTIDANDIYDIVV